MKEGVEQFKQQARLCKRVWRRVVWSWPLTKTGPGLIPAHASARLQRSYDILRSMKSLFAEDIIFGLRTFFPIATVRRGTTHYAVDFYRGLCLLSRDELPIRTDLSRRVQRVLLFRGNNPVSRGDSLAVLLACDPQRPGPMGIVQTLASWKSTTKIPEENCANIVEAWCSTAHPAVLDALLAVADEYKGRRQRSSKAEKRRVRGWDVNKRLEHSLVKGITAFIVDDYRRGRPAMRAPNRSDRKAR